MAKASPIIRSFNGGEWSALMEGRTDIDRYPSSVRKMEGYVAAPQGPAIPRSGTAFMGKVYDETKKTVLIPFVFSETDFLQLEFSPGRLRFFTEFGLLTRQPEFCTMVARSPIVVELDPAWGGVVGEEVVISLLPEASNLNGTTARITAISGNQYTLDATYLPIPDPASMQVARVYHVDSPYTEDQLEEICDLQRFDTFWLLHPTVKPYKLKRLDTYDWRFEAIVFTDGPYLPQVDTTTKLTLSATGKATPNMTSNTTPSGVCSGSSNDAGSDYYLAFDNPALPSYWRSNTNQSGIIQYRSTGAPFVADGYSIALGDYNANTSYTSKDHAPSNFTFEGSNDGTNWTILDTQKDYVLYDGMKSVFFPLDNAVAYEYYRLNVTACTRNGTVNPTIRSLIIRSTTSVNVTITASSTTDINGGLGFLTTDEGRLIRIQGSDAVWRSLRITSRTSATEVQAVLLDEPFPDLAPSSKWRLGVWSDTTGYPNAGVFGPEDRLWLGGSTKYPDALAASMPEFYDRFAPTTPDGEVLDTSGIFVQLNTPKLSRIRWLAVGKDGILAGTGLTEAQVLPLEGSGKNVTANSIRVKTPTQRGSANVRAVSVDGQTLFVQRSARTLREFAYSYEADSFKAPSMSQLASHLGITKFKKLAYAAEPYSIVWVLREDGRIVGLTYNRDENVVGWHQHPLPDLGSSEAFVESISVLPGTERQQDVLWMIVRRTVNGQTRRFVEKLTPFWDFGMDLSDAHYVDCALRYSGAPATRLYNLTHVEGRVLYGLADGAPIGPITVADGSVLLPFAASNVILGFGFDSLVTTARLENGAADGTAIGKVKRMHNVTVLVWDSFGGDIGVKNHDTGVIEYEPMEYYYKDYSIEVNDGVVLQTGFTKPIPLAAGYEVDGCLYIRRRKETPLPCNVLALLPQLVTQDNPK